MEEIKENNTLIEDQQPISYRPDNNSSPGFHITRKGLLFIAVIVMYVAAIGMPFIGDRFGSGFFEMRGSLGYIVLLAFDSMGKFHQFASILELIAAIALFVIPLFYFLISGSDEDLKYAGAIALIQLGCLFYFSKSWFIDNSFVRLSWGFYFYLIPTIVALCIGFKASGDTTYLMNFFKDVFAKIKKAWIFQWIDEQECRFFPTTTNGKSIAGNVLLGTIATGLFLTITNNQSKIGGDMQVAKFICACSLLGIICYVLLNTSGKDVPWPDKLKHILALLIVCCIGALLGYYPSVLFIVLITSTIIGNKIQKQ